MTDEQKDQTARIAAEWWLCFRCWIAYHVPTTFFYGPCQQCGEATRPWPTALERVRMMELVLKAKTKGQTMTTDSTARLVKRFVRDLGVARSFVECLDTLALKAWLPLLQDTLQAGADLLTAQQAALDRFQQAISDFNRTLHDHEAALETLTRERDELLSVKYGARDEGARELKARAEAAEARLVVLEQELEELRKGNR